MSSNNINTGAFDSLVGRLLNIEQQQGGICPVVSAEITPVLVLENDRPEWCYLKNERCMAAGTKQGAAGAAISAVRLRNPLASGMLVVIETATFSTSGNAEVLFTIGSINTDRAALPGNQSRDTRSQVSGVAVVSRDNAAVAGTGIFDVFITANTPFVAQFNPTILKPGTFFEIATVTVNVDLCAVLGWRERELRNYEL